MYDDVAERRAPGSGYDVATTDLQEMETALDFRCSGRQVGIGEDDELTTC